MDFASFKYKNAQRETRIVEYESMNKIARAFVKISLPVVFALSIIALVLLVFSAKANLSLLFGILSGFFAFLFYLAHSLITANFTRYENQYGRITKESRHTLKTEEKFYI